ncbi:hypothetical protein Celaphus_00006587 [Cervus elaphus hippelaphus]|uniref:Uncharacterized protein n=1 Tax=Cervus elaphus hippelaphus TaxID=46360 RepID=A0A212CUX7_CEREH|nr:hypothetical protein Celaphus_00006587 [Cervus elaphus hippelaphus]
MPPLQLLQCIVDELSGRDVLLASSWFSYDLTVCGIRPSFRLESSPSRLYTSSLSGEPVCKHAMPSM